FVWWTLLDWYTILTGVQTMGLVSMDKKMIKPAFFEVQRLYSRTARDYTIKFLGLMNNQKLRGPVNLDVLVVPADHIRSVSYSLGDLDFRPLSRGEERYQARIDTARLKDGRSSFLVRLELDNGEVLYQKLDVLIDNIDDPPVVSLNLQQDKILMKNFELKVNAADDGTLTLVQYRIDGLEPVRLSGQDGYYRQRLDFSAFQDNSRHTIEVMVKDDGKHTFSTNIRFVYDNTPGIRIDLPYDLDRIAWKENKQDEYFWGFPAEELPDSRTWIVCDGCNAKLFFPDKKDKANNVMVSLGNYIRIKPDHYSVLNIWGYSYWGNVVNDLKVYYQDGTEEKLELKLSEWTTPNPQCEDHRAYYCSQHYETSGKDGMPSTSFYHSRLLLNSKKKLKAIEFPNDSHKHILAAGLEK
ncbi:MAG: hypothetical protein PHF84_06700, partial [bacterium]|nr:hypothetical protein [bacterium]